MHVWWDSVEVDEKSAEQKNRNGRDWRRKYRHLAANTSNDTVIANTLANLYKKLKKLRHTSYMLVYKKMTKAA